MAYDIEARITNNSLGKQDHYIASFGGIKHIQYNKKKIKIIKNYEKNCKIN